MLEGIEIGGHTPELDNWKAETRLQVWCFLALVTSRALMLPTGGRGSMPGWLTDEAYTAEKAFL